MRYYSVFSFKTYEVRIRGGTIKQDNVLWGNFTEFLRFTTQKALPGAVPTGVSVVDTMDGVVQVTWIPIPPEYENGELKNYVLTYKRQNWGRESTDLEIPIKQTVHLIPDLLPFRFYDVRWDVSFGVSSGVCFAS